MTSPAPARLDALTGLRYLAALTVLLAHTAASISHGFGVKTFLTCLSGVGMVLFFTLSGFLLTYTYYPAFAQSLSRPLRSFYVARFARIYPVYVLCLLLSFSFCGNFFSDLRSRPADTLTSLACTATLTQDWAHIEVFQDFNNPRTVALAYNGVAWSVSAEAFFYLLFPLVAAFALPLIRRAWHAVVLVGVLSLAYLAFDVMLARTHPDFASGFSLARWLFYLCPYVRFGEFLAGCFVGRAFLLRQSVPVTERERRWGAGVLYSSLAALFVINYVVLKGDPPIFLRYYVQNFGTAPLSLVVLYCLARYPSALERLLSTKPLVALGEASYVVYLIHPLFLSYAYARLQGEGGLTHGPIILFNTLAALVVLHCAAFGMYKYFEEPMRRFLRKWLGGRDKSEGRATTPLARAA